MKMKTTLILLVMAIAAAFALSTARTAPRAPADREDTDLFVAGGTAVASLASTEQAQSAFTPIVTLPVKTDVSLALRDIPPLPVAGQIGDKEPRLPKSFLSIPFRPDPVLQGPQALAAAMP